MVEFRTDVAGNDGGIRDIAEMLGDASAATRFRAWGERGCPRDRYLRLTGPDDGHSRGTAGVWRQSCLSRSSSWRGEFNVFQSEAVSLRSVAKGFLKAAIPALALSFVAHSGALATTYIIDRGDMPNKRTLNIQGIGNVSAGPFLFDGTYGVGGQAFTDIIAFCVDIYHHISTGNYTPDLAYTDTIPLTFDSNPGGQASHWSGPTGFSAASLTRIGQLVNYGTLSFEDATLTGVARDKRLAAVQGAIWQVASGRNVTGDGLDATIDNLSAGQFGSSYGAISAKYTFITPQGVYPSSRGKQSFAFAAVPEPGTWALLIAGFGLTGAALRRSRQRLALVQAA